MNEGILKAKDDEILELFKMCNEKDKEIERLKELSKVDSQQGQEIIIELKQEIERLQNIIKEAKEYLKQYMEFFATNDKGYEILKILDKGE